MTGNGGEGKMGMTRKLASIMTLGLIDFRSDKERMARYEKKQLKELKRQRKAAEMQGKPRR